MHPPYPPSRPPSHATPPTSPPAPAPVPTATGTLLATAAWRLVIVVCAVVGLRAALDLGGGWSMGTVLPLSQLASLTTALCYGGILVADLAAAAMRRPEPRTAWLRGQLAITLLLVAVVWFTIMEGDVDETWSLFEHLVTPLVVVVDWLLLGRRQTRAPWWYPVSWLGPLLVYLVVLTSNEEHNPYDFLDPDDSEFVGFVAGTLVGVLLGGLLLVALARARAGAGTPAGGPAPVPAAGPAPPPPPPPPAGGPAPYHPWAGYAPPQQPPPPPSPGNPYGA